MPPLPERWWAQHLGWPGVIKVVDATPGVAVTTTAAKRLVLVDVATTLGTAVFEGTTAAAPLVLLLLSWFTHILIYRCVDLSGIPVCCAEKPSLDYGCPTGGKLKGRDKMNNSCCYNDDATLFFTFLLV